MCDECHYRDMMLPSLESFAERWRLPKVYYLFYHYFLRAVIGDARWKSRMTEKKKLGTAVAEAYAHATLRNHYFAWLYEYKAGRPGNTLRTEYDAVLQAAVDGSDNEDHQGLLPTPPSLFCGDLDMVEVSVPTRPAQAASSTTAEEEVQEGDDNIANRDDFKLLVEGPDPPEELRAAMEDVEKITKEIRRRIHEGRTGAAQGGALSSGASHYAMMQARLAEDEAAAVSSPDTVADGRNSAKKRKRKSKGSLRDFTKEPRKTKRGSNSIKGWSVKGKRYVEEMMSKITEDERSGIRKKWEELYHKLCVMESQAEEEGDEDEEGAGAAMPFEMDETLMYCEV